MRKAVLLGYWVALLGVSGVAGGCGPVSEGRSWLDSTSIAGRIGHYGQEEAEEEERPDRPDLALLQEINRTRDPATGTVPRERLLVAEARAEQLMALGAQQRTSASVLSAATWTEKGPSNVGGRTRAIMVDPSDATGNKVWASSVGGGLWKSNNAAGATPTWTAVNNFFANIAITTLAYDPTNTDIMYFGTGEGFGNVDGIRGLGIWKSTDHGVTWAQLASTNNSAFYYVNKLVVDKNGWVYAATNTNGLQRSKDNGSTWTGVAFTSNSVSDVDVNPVNGTVYMTVGNFTTSGGIYRSTSGDAGTFTDLKALPSSGLPPSGTTTRAEVAIAPSDPNQLYALFCSSGSGTPAVTANTLYGIYRSSDGGTTWQALPKPADADTGIPAADFTRTQAWYDLAIAVSPTDPNTVFVGGVDIFKTANGQATTASSVSWQQVAHWYGGFGFQYAHADQHAIAFVPGSGTQAYFGNDGGIFSTANAAAAIPTLKAINTNYNVTQFYALAVHPTDVDYFLAGAQDNGTQRYTTAGGMVTTEATGGDGAFCFIDQNEPQYQFTAYVYAQYRRSTNGGSTFSDYNFSSSAGQFINPTDYDSRSNTLYFAWSVNQIAIIPNAPTSSSGSALTLATGAGLVSHVTVSPNTQDRVFVGTQPSGSITQGHLYRIDNAATPATRTITRLYTAPAGMAISSVAVETGNDAHLLVTLSNYSATNSKVLETTGGTAAGNATTDAATWTSRQGDLPDMPVRWAVFDPGNSARALLATELGVWSTENLAATSPAWSPSSTGLANVRVDMLRIRPTDQQLVAATHGRGLFTSDILKNLPLPVELTSFSGRATDQGVALRWQTAAEKNSAHFEVERAAVGQSFQPLARVAAAGSSTTARSYAYTDGSVARGLYYYRLRQVDKDGTFAYSPLVAVLVSPAAAPLITSVYPNPFGRELTVQLREALGGSSTTLTDLQGRVVFSQYTAGPARSVALTTPDGLAPGAYILTVRQGSQQASRRVIHR